MSGVKGRSGRKPDPVVKSCRAVIEENISPEQWKQVWAALVTAASQGSIPALRLLLEYRFGSARPEPLPPPPAAANNHIAYYLPIRPDEPLPLDAIVVKDEPLESTPGSAD